MYNKIISSLKLIGFNNIETEVYRSILSSPKINQLQIHKQTGIDRRKIKDAITFLNIKGLIDTTDKSQIVSKDPAKIISLIEFYEYELKKEKIQAKAEVHKLVYEYHSTAKKVAFYDSPSDYIILFNSILDNTSEIYHIGDEKSFVDIVGRDYFEIWLQKRVDRDIKAFDLTFNLGNLSDLNISQLPNTIFGLLPYQNIVPGSIIFWNNKIAIFSSTMTKLVVIEDIEIYNIFVQLWKVIYQLVGNKS